RRGHDPHRHGKPHATPKRSSVNFQKGSYRGSFDYNEVLQYLPKAPFDDENARDFIATVAIENHNKIEELHLKINNYEKIIGKLHEDTKSNEQNYNKRLLDVESQYKNAIMKLNQEKERYSEAYQENIKESAREFLGGVVNSLIKRENELNIFSILWSGFGALCLIFGVYLICKYSKSDIENINIS
ncbi:hypothetical protein, partial [Acetobacter cerevisiae]